MEVWLCCCFFSFFLFLFSILIHERTGAACDSHWASWNRAPVHLQWFQDLLWSEECASSLWKLLLGCFMKPVLVNLPIMDLPAQNSPSDAQCHTAEKTFGMANGLCTEEPPPSVAFHHSHASRNFRISPMIPGMSIQVKSKSRRKAPVAFRMVIVASLGTMWTWSIICDAQPRKSMLRMPIGVWRYQGCATMKVTYTKTSRVGYVMWMMAMLVVALTVPKRLSAGLIWLSSQVLK